MFAACFFSFRKKSRNFVGIEKRVCLRLVRLDIVVAMSEIELSIRTSKIVIREARQ